MKNTFNHLFTNHFSNCRLLGKGYDPHRQREVEFRQVPGHFDIVGITDGVDAWICPANSPFIVKVKQALDEILAGGNPPVVMLARDDDQPAKKQRKRVAVDEEEAPPQPRARRRVVEEDPEPQPRRRLHVRS